MEKACAGIMRLPQELVATIIQENQKDKTTLRSCSLVTHSWTYPSQGPIFSRISFNRHQLSGNNDRFIERFRLLISVRPLLATLVKAVEISPLFDAQLLTHTLQQLVNLKCISLNLCQSHWHELSQSMQDTLHDAFRSPQITNVELQDGHFLHSADFSALIGTNAHLKQLSLSTISCEDLGVDQGAHESSLRLSSLALSLDDGSCLNLVRVLQASLSLSNLQCLSVLTTQPEYLAEHASTMKGILRQLNGRPLERLVVNVCLGEPLSGVLDISRLRSIQIRLWWTRPERHTKPDEWLRWLSDSLKDLTRVEEITLEIFCASSFTAYNEWGALDAALERMLSLKRVYVNLDMYNSISGRWRLLREYPGTVREDMRSVLPTVASKGLLDVEIAANYPG
ncbi:hypothetical protein ARMSODRAFT_1014204 [Armillaria solidipes]|uniref:F-box domain-containing protein n=1 Tax=Armillaria solidipes TaxID=1076256 RepID=A0A2H3CAB4_9AGAR|nr:hypothetical protein ARMSODRAFT_1014204 [Armillaria solidipes]